MARARAAERGGQAKHFGTRPVVGGWARKLRSPKEAPVREEAAPPEEPYSADPLMMFYNKISPARGQEKSDPAAVESESRLETGGIEAEARSREAELWALERHRADKARWAPEWHRADKARWALERHRADKSRRVLERHQTDKARWALERHRADKSRRVLEWHRADKARLARLAQEARLRDVPANIEVPYEELKALHERGPLAAHKRVMILASFKRQQLEYDVVENPASEKQWPRRADTELRSWVINHKLHQFLYRNLREERRRVDIMNRQRLVARKKLRISPDLPDPVAEVEARVHQFIVQRDAQAIVRKSKEFTRKNHRRLVLAERAGLHALIAQGLPEVGDVRRGRIIAGLRRKEERVARINAKKQRKALKQAIQKSEGSSG
ncbi:hypothetical protein F5144DRAFT_487267 [Chaetomium tenue]|uniref:Uncharacterized protein n=1 Tax=Chaetomium tenue TaxID=1854479 RepID=A0ACB7PCC6_9PEZI|nr:hypothetical protein F5144DRAFT_487267 [Chaetomium globosum]